MNKYQEAFNKIDDYCYGHSINDSHKKLKNDFKLIQELINKETPKKPLKDYSINAQFPMIKFQYICPNCKKTLSLYYDEVPVDFDNHCGHCGQKIDWSEVD